MIGARAGIAAGIRAGVAAGISADPIAASALTMASVSRDATSLIYCPANATEWATTMAVAGITSGGPSLLWLCQEASGNLADSIGTFTGTAAGTPITYRQAVAGWSRLAILGSNGGTGVVLNSSASLPNAATTSMLAVSYVVFTGAPSTTRSIQSIAPGTGAQSRILATPKLRGVCFLTSVDGTANPLGVRCLDTLYDVTNNLVRVTSDQEKINVTRSALSGKSFLVQFGFPGGYLYTAAFFGAAAEMSDAQRKTLYQTLGWTIQW